MINDETETYMYMEEERGDGEGKGRRGRIQRRLETPTRRGGSQMPEFERGKGGLEEENPLDIAIKEIVTTIEVPVIETVSLQESLPVSSCTTSSQHHLADVKVNNANHGVEEMDFNLLSLCCSSQSRPGLPPRPESIHFKGRL